MLLNDTLSLENKGYLVVFPKIIHQIFNDKQCKITQYDITTIIDQVIIKAFIITKVC